MKNELDKSLKRWLKRKVSITQGLLIAFMITGGFGISQLSFAGNVEVGGGVANDGSVAIGSKNNEASGDQSIAIGDDTHATGNSSIAIGNDDTARLTGDRNPNSYTDYIFEGKPKHALVGQALKDLTGKDLNDPKNYINTESKGHGSVAIGVKAYSGAALSATYGTGAYVTDNSVLGLAFGAGSLVDKQNGVSLGAGSKTDGSAVYVPKSIIQTLDDNGNPTGTTETYNKFAGGGDTMLDGDQVSIGSIGFERQIKNLAPGRIASDSTDAINGSQLFSVTSKQQNRLDKLEEGNIDTYFHFNDPDITQKAGDPNKNLGGIKDKAGATGEKSITGGIGAKATGQSSIAFGTDSEAIGSGQYASVAIGDQAKSLGNGTVAIGERAVVVAGKWEGVAIGSRTKVSEHEGIAIGSDIDAAGQRAIVIGQQAGLRDANSVYQIPNSSEGDFSIAIGSGAKRFAETQYAANANGNYSIVMGTDARSEVSANEGIAIGRASKVSGAQGIAIGGGSIDTGNDLVAKEPSRKGANVTAEKGIAIGNESKVEGIRGIAIGSEALASGVESISIGKGNIVSGDHSGAFGDPSNISGANSYSVGNNNNIPVDKTFVLGNKVTASQENSVILGDSSTDRAFTTETSATVGPTTYTGFAGTPTGVVSVGAAGKERQIINVAPGKISADSTDAINGSQLYAVAEKAGKGLVLSHSNIGGGEDSTPNNNDFDLGAGEKLTIDAGKNIKISQSDGTISIATTDDVATKGDLKEVKDDLTENINEVKDDVAKEIKTVKDDIDDLDKKVDKEVKDLEDKIDDEIDDVKDEITKLDDKIDKEVDDLEDKIDDEIDDVKDAVEKDIKGIDDKVTEFGKHEISLGSDDGETSAQQLDQKKIKFDIVGDGKYTETEANGSRVKVKLTKDTTDKIDKIDGIEDSVDEIKKVKIKLGSNNGDTDEQNLSGNVKFDIVGEDGIETEANGSKVKVKLDPTTKAKIDNAADKNLSNITDEAKKNITKLGTVVEAGDNTTVDIKTDATTGQKTYTVNVTASDTVNAGDKGPVSGDAVNTAITDAKNEIKEMPLTFKADTNEGTGKDKGSDQKLDSSIEFLTGESKDGFSGENLHTKVENGKIIIGMKDKPEFDEVTTKKVTGLDKGNVSADSKDAVNGAQLFETNTKVENNAAEIAKGINIAADNGTDDNVALGDTIKYTSTDGTVTTTVSANQIDFKVTTTPLVDANDDGTVDTPANPNAIATAGDVAKAINASFWKTTAKTGVDGGVVKGAIPRKIRAGEEVNFDAGKNMELTQTADGYIYATKDEVEFDKVTTDELKAGPVIINNDGIDAGEKQIKNVASAGDINDPANGKNAVNAGDVSKALKAAAVKVDTDTPDLVTIDKENPNSDGGTTYKVNIQTTPLTGNTADGTVNTPTNPNSLATAGDIANAINNVVANSGWELQEKGAKKDKVTSGNIVDFIDGAGTEVSVDNSIKDNTKIKYDIKLNSDTMKLDPNGNVTVNTTPLEDANDDGKVDTPANPNAIATAGDVANAINNASHKVSGLNSDKQVDAQDGIATIKTGETLEIEAGKNLVLKADAGNKKLELSTAKEVEFDKVSVDGVFIDKNGINAGGKEIKGVAAGTTDDAAVNLKQLKDNAESIANALGGGSTVNSDGSITAPTFEVVDPVTGQNTAPATVADAVKNLSDAVNNPLYIKADLLEGKGKEKSSEQKLGSTLEIVTGETSDGTSGDNLETKVEDGKVTISMKDKPVFEEVTAKEGLTIGEGADAIVMAPSKTKTVNGAEVPAVDMGGKTFTGLASNLPDTNTTKGEKPNDLVSSNAATLGDVLNSGWNLQVEGKDADFVKPYDTVNFAAKADSGLTVEEKADSTDGKTTIEIGIAKGSVTANENGEAEAGKPDGFVTGSQVADAINNAGFKLDIEATADGEKGTDVTTQPEDELIKNGKKVIVEADENIKISQAKNKITVATKKDVKFDKVSVGGVVIDKDNGIDAGNKKITGVAPAKIGDNSTDAVNGSQLKDLADKLGLKPDASGNSFAAPTLTPIENADGTTSSAPTNLVEGVNQVAAKVNEGINFGASNTTKGNQKLGSTLEVIASDKVAGETYSEKNLTTTYTKDADGNGKILVEMNEKPEFKGLKVTDASGDVTEITPAGVTVTGNGKAPVKLTKDGLDNGGNKISNVAAGEDDTDAVNVSQLKAAADNNPFEYTDADGNTLVKAADGKYYPADANGKPDMSATPVAEKDVNISSKGDAKPLNNIKGIVGNNVGDGAIGKDDAQNAVADLLKNTKDLNTAATVGDLQALAQAGLDFAGDDSADTTIHKELGKKLEIIGGADKTKLTENNIGVNAVDGKLKVQLTKELEGLTSVETVDGAGNKTKQTGKGLTITPADGTAPVSLTDKGLDNGGNKISNVAAGEDDTDAVNFGQLKDNAQSIANALGGNTKVNPDGSISAPTFTLTNGNPEDGGTTEYNTVGDALNGLNEAVTKPITFKADENADTDTDGSQNKLGSEFSILAGNATETSTKNLKTKVEDNKVTISMTEKPVFKEVTAEEKLTIGKDDDAIVFEPTKTTALKDGAQAPVNALDMKGSTFTGLASNITPVTNEASVTNPNFTDAQKSNAATLGDVLNAGWNLQVEGQDADFVKPYDTVNFAAKADSGITVEEKADSTEGKTTIEIGIAKGSVSSNADTGLAEAGQPDGFVTGSQVADAINSSFWKTQTGTSEDDGEVETADEVKVKAGNKVEFTSGKNMKVKQVNTADGVKYIYATKDEVEFDKTTVGNVVTDGKTNKITGLEAGTDDKDAVNFGQIKAISNSIADTFGGKKKVNPDGTVSTEFEVPGLEGGPFNNVGDALKGIGKELDKGHEFYGDMRAPGSNETQDHIKRKHGERLYIKGGIANVSDLASDPNIGVQTDSDNTMLIRLAKNLRLGTDGSVGFEGTKLDAFGLVINDGPKVTKTDVDMSGLQIKGVKAGEEGTDAVNVDQLKEFTAKAKTVVEKGSHIKEVVKTTGKNGEDIYTINAKNIESGSNGLTVNEDDDKFTIDLSQANKDALENAKKGFNITADEVETSASDQANKKDNVGLTENIKFTGGDRKNIVTTVSDNKIKFDLANTITIGDANKGEKPVIINGTDGNITGLTNLTFDKDATYNGGMAATQEQLKAAYDEAKNFANEKTFGLKDSGGNELTNNVDKTIEVVGADKNITTEVKNGKFQIKLTDKLENIKSIKGLENTIKVYTDNGIKPTNLDEIGSKAANINDLMNIGWNLQNNGEKRDFVTAYDTVNFADGIGTTAVVETVDGVSTVKVNVNTGEFTTSEDGSITAKDPKGGFVTDDQVVDAISKSGFTVKANSDDATKSVVNPGESVDFISENSNIEITKEKDNNDIKFKLADDIKVKTVEADKVTAKEANIGGIELKSTTTTAMGEDGKTAVINTQPALDLDGKSITNLADNLVHTDHATKSQAKPDAQKVNGKNAATVNDVLNAGWNLETNGESKDFVKSYDTVNFEGEGPITVKHNTVGDKNNIVIGIEKGGLTSNEDGTTTATPKTDGFVTASQVTDAINNSGFSLSANGKDSKLVKSGNSIDIKNTDNNLVITKTDTANGTEVNYDLAKEIKVDKVTLGNVVISKDDGINAGDKKITNVALGEISKDSKDAINGSQLFDVKDELQKNIDNLAGKAITYVDDEGNESAQSLGSKFRIIAGNSTETSTKNLKTTIVKKDGEANGIEISMAEKPEFKEIVVRENENDIPVKLTAKGLDNGGNTITNVAAGVNPNDAVNVSQLRGVRSEANLGTASALAAGAIPQVTFNRKFGVGAGFGHFKGQSAVAVGISGQSNTNNVVYKANLTFAKKAVGVSAGVNVSFGETTGYMAPNLKLLEKVNKLEEKVSAMKEHQSIIYVLDNFGLDIHSLTEDQIQKLKEVKTLVERNIENNVIEIIGYTDRAYTEQYNLDLGLRRARVVRAKLEELGLNPDIAIKIRSKGYNEITDGSEAQLRRVEIIINHYSQYR